MAKQYYTEICPEYAVIKLFFSYGVHEKLCEDLLQRNMCVRGNRCSTGDDNQTPNEANKVSKL